LSFDLGCLAIIPVHNNYSKKERGKEKKREREREREKRKKNLLTYVVYPKATSGCDEPYAVSNISTILAPS
jgi:hypothetical protein